MSLEHDVIIVGAGASGLSAAKELTKLGISYVVVEGSHRIGGRAYSEEIAPGVWFDLGCSYLHQGENNPFVAIADDLGVTLGKEHGDMFNHIRAYKNGVQLTTVETEAIRDYVAACDAAIRTSVARGEDVAIVELVDLDSEFSVPYMAAMADTNTHDIDQVSALDYARFLGGGKLDIPVLNGYGNLVAVWGADVPVSLNTKVERINWSDTQAIVKTSKGTLRGHCVLSTVSTGVLGAGDIEFYPRLPDWKMDAIFGLPTGTENKICLHFDCDVFGTDGRGFHSVWNDEGDAAGFEASVMGHNTAVVFLGGREAIWLEKQGQQAGRDYAVDRVAEVFGNDVRQSVTRSIVTAWTTEPWTKGSYSCAMPGQAHQRTELAKPLDGRLFFAGEATTVGDNSMCHGAYNSGIRAAQEIALALAAD